MDGEEDEAGEGGCGGEGEHPAGKQGRAGADRLRLGGRFEDGRLCEVDDGAAVGARGQMGERRLLLVKRQRVLDEGVELVRVGMLAGLEECAHSIAGGWLVAGCVRVV
jgi:hypothetical protein